MHIHVVDYSTVNYLSSLVLNQSSCSKVVVPCYMYMYLLCYVCVVNLYSVWGQLHHIHSLDVSQLSHRPSSINTVLFIGWWKHNGPTSITLTLFIRTPIFCPSTSLMRNLLSLFTTLRAWPWVADASWMANFCTGEMTVTSRVAGLPFFQQGRYRLAGQELTSGISNGTSFQGAKAADWQGIPEWVVAMDTVAVTPKTHMVIGKVVSSWLADYTSRLLLQHWHSYM